MRFPLDMQVLYLCPRVFIIYLLFVLSQVFAVDVDDSLECKICNGYQICGRKQFRMPECFNGVPCTKEQHLLCKKMTASTQNEDCDRPGKFPDSKSPNKFYTCNINGSDFEKHEETCPPHTTFDAKTKHCLTPDEKTVLTIAENYDSRTTSDDTKFYCTGFGTFPDPHDCKMYHSCNEKFVSEDFYCSHGMYFNGFNCTTTKHPECMNQLKKKFSNEIKQGEEVYKRVQKLLENDKQKNNSIVFKSFESSTENKLTIYVGEEKPEAVTNDRENVTNYQGTFETEKKAESKYRLSAIRKLQENAKNMALKTIITAKIMEETVNEKICEEEDVVEEGTLKLKFSVFDTVNFAVIECNSGNNETKLNPQLTSQQMQTTHSEVIATDHTEETNTEQEITTDATTLHQTDSLELKTNTSAEYSTAVTLSNREITTNVNDLTNNLGDTITSTFVIPSSDGMTVNFKQETDPVTTYTEPITSGYDEHTSAPKYKSTKMTTFDSETTSSIINDTNMTHALRTEAIIVMGNPTTQEESYSNRETFSSTETIVTVSYNEKPSPTANTTFTKTSSIATENLTTETEPYSERETFEANYGTQEPTVSTEYLTTQREFYSDRDTMSPLKFTIAADVRETTPTIENETNTNDEYNKGKMTSAEHKPTVTEPHMEHSSVVVTNNEKTTSLHETAPTVSYMEPSSLGEKANLSTEYSTTQAESYTDYKETISPFKLTLTVSGYENSFNEISNPEQQTKFTARETETTAADKENTFIPKHKATTPGSITTHFAINEEENLDLTDEKTTSSFQTKPSVIEPYSNSPFYIYSQQTGKTSTEYEPTFAPSHSETTYFYTQNTYDGKTTADLKHTLTTADSYSESPFQKPFGFDHEDNETDLKPTATVLLTETPADISIDEEYNETHEGSSKYEPTNANSDTELQTTLQEHEALTTVNNVANGATALSPLKPELTNKEPTVETNTDADATVSFIEHKPTTTGFYITNTSPGEESFNGKTKHEITTAEFSRKPVLLFQINDDPEILSNNTQNKQTTDYNSESPYKTEAPTVVPATIYTTFSVDNPSTYSNNKSDADAADETTAFFGHNRTIPEYSEVTSSEITHTEKTTSSLILLHKQPVKNHLIAESLMKDTSTQQSEKTESYHYFTTFANEKQTDTPSYTESFGENEKASPNYTPIQQEIYSYGKTDSLAKTTVVPFEKETLSPVLQEEKTKFETNTQTPKISTDYSTTQEESLNNKQKISPLKHEILVDSETAPPTTHDEITFTEKQNISTEYSLPEADSYSKRETMDSSKLTPSTVFDENAAYTTNAVKPNIPEENTTTASEPYSCVTSNVEVTSPSYTEVQPEPYNSIETISPCQSSIPHNTSVPVTNKDEKKTNPEDIITATASYTEPTTVRDENTPVLKRKPIKIAKSDWKIASTIPEDENTTYPTYVTKPSFFIDSSTTQEQPYSDKETTSPQFTVTIDDSITIPSAVDQTNTINLTYTETPNIFTADYKIDTTSYSDRETYETKYVTLTDKTNISTTHTESYSERETQTESYDGRETISSSKITTAIKDNKTTSPVDVQTDHVEEHHETNSGEPLSSIPTVTETYSEASEVHDLYESKGTSEEQKSTFPVPNSEPTSNTDVYKYYEEQTFISTQMLTTPEVFPESSSVSDEMVDGKKFSEDKTTADVKTTPPEEVFIKCKETETVETTYGKTASSEVFNETAVNITHIQDQETAEGCNGKHDLGNTILQPEKQLTTVEFYNETGSDVSAAEEEISTFFTTESTLVLYTSASSYLSETEESNSSETSITTTTEIPDYGNGSTVYLSTTLPESTPKIKQFHLGDKTPILNTTTPPAIKTTNRTKFTTALTISTTKTHQVSLTLTSTNLVQKFRCLSAGYFADPNDCHSYYQCVVVSTNKIRCPKCRVKRLKFVPVHHTCSNGKWFSKLFARCIRFKPLRCYFRLL